MNYHEIKDFKGLFTNADTDDIPNEYLTALSNLRPVFGKLTKTFGAGLLFTNAETPANEVLPETPNNIATFMNSKLVYNAMLGNAQISITVNGSTKFVTLYVYDKSALDWVALDDLVDVVFSGTYYHKSARNAYFQYADQLRLLPGNVAKADGTNVSRGIWLGYIDRDYFDGAYSPDGKFYDYPADLTKPDISSSGLSLNIDATLYGSYNPEGEQQYSRFYALSYVYDGIQESLMSTPMSINYGQRKFAKLSIEIDETTHNKRITAIRIYRSTNEGGPYYLIHTVDFLRETAKTLSGAALFGHSAFYIPSNGVTFNSGVTYKISPLGTSATKYQIDNPGNGTHDVFTLASGIYGIAEDYWNSSWYIYSSADSYVTPIAQGTTGLYCGSKTLITAVDGYLDDGIDTGSGSYTAGSVRHGSTYYTVLENNGKAIHVLRPDAPDYRNTGVYTLVLMNLTNGLYLCDSSKGIHKYEIFDVGLPDQTHHALEGEVSIHTNAEFALVVGNRCWLANMVIDPTTKAEVRTDIGGYSELGQVDVVPAGNAVPLEDREGGECTGLSEMFGDPVYLKKHALITIFSRNNPDDPLKWRPFTSVHNIGNFAKRGYIVVAGVLYVCSADGIYGVSPNNLAEADSTPTKTLKISGKIENSYLALTQAQKEAITVVFDQNLSEIIWNLNGTYFHYNTVTGEWRNTTMTPSMTLADYDGYGNAIIYSTSQNKMYKIGTAETVIGSFTTKDFVISDLRKDVVRYMWVKYKSTVALTVSLYLDGSSSAETTTYTLAASTTETVARVRISCRCKRLRVKIAESSATATATEIAMVRIEHEGEGR